jgi:hypothetical protein
MTNFSADDIVAQIDKLLAEYEALKKIAKHPDLSDLRDESNTFVIRLRSAIERLSPRPSTYFKEMQAIAEDKQNSTSLRIRAYLGILQALRADIIDGWLQGVSELLHADTLSDFLEQAAELADKGYENAAAVIAGSTLEAHIRLLCEKYSINVQLPSGQPMKADTMNAELVKAPAYNKLQQKAIASWQAIRNAAAHGEYDKYTKMQVVSMIASVRDFILEHPA